jgi:3-oxoacyl-[acyl-carrier-protein] synthase-3
VLTNAELEQRVPDLSGDWITKVLGIEERRVLRPSESLEDLALQALDGALARAGWDPESVDAVVCGTSFVDDLLPATASLVAADRCHHAVAFDLNAACASGLYAVAVARSLMAVDPRLHRVAVLVAERPTAWADYRDRESCVFWGDGAACLLLSDEPGDGCFEVLDVALVNDNEHASKVRVRRGGSFRHDGRYSYQQVLTLSSKGAAEVLGRVGASAADLRAFVGHQSNLRLLAELGDRLGVAWDRQWHNVAWAGNQGAAGVATAFSGGWHDHAEELADGDLVLLTAVGGGYSGAALLLRWQA